jgi:hypothetical protein
MAIRQKKYTGRPDEYYLPKQDRLNGGAPGAWQCRCQATTTMLSRLLPQIVSGFLLAHLSVSSQTHWRTVGDPSLVPCVTSPFVFHPVDRVELVELPDRLFRLIKSPRNLSPVSRLFSAFLLSINLALVYASFFSSTTIQHLIRNLRLPELQRLSWHKLGDRSSRAKMKSIALVPVLATILGLGAAKPTETLPEPPSKRATLPTVTVSGNGRGFLRGLDRCRESLIT